MNTVNEVEWLIIENAKKPPLAKLGCKIMSIKEDSKDALLCAKPQTQLSYRTCFLNFKLSVTLSNYKFCYKVIKHSPNGGRRV